MKQRKKAAWIPIQIQAKQAIEANRKANNRCRMWDTWML